MKYPNILLIIAMLLLTVPLVACEAIEGVPNEETIEVSENLVDEQADVASAPTQSAINTPSATASPTFKPTATSTVAPVLTETPTSTATSTETPTDTPAPTASPTTPPLLEVQIASSSANVRNGPGINYESITTLQENDIVLVLATNNDGSWYNVALEDSSTGWLAVSVSTPLSESSLALVPVAATIPAPPTTSVSSPTLAPQQSEPLSDELVITFVNQTPNKNADIRMWDCCESMTFTLLIGETVVKKIPPGDYGWEIQSTGCWRTLPNISPLDREIQIEFIPIDSDKCEMYVAVSGENSFQNQTFSVNGDGS